MNYREAKIAAEKFYLSGEKLDKNVFIKHHDGSTMHFTYSSYKKVDDEWILISTEHHGFFVYHVEDLDCIKIKEFGKDDDYEFMSEYVILANAASVGEEINNKDDN